MKRLFSFALAFILLLSCSGCTRRRSGARPDAAQQAAMDTLLNMATQTSPAPAEETVPALRQSPFDVVPAAYDPEAPEGDTAGKGYAALMDRLAEQIRDYDGSAGGEYTVTVEATIDIPANNNLEFLDELFLHTVRENPEIFWVNLGSRANSYDADRRLITYVVSVFPEFQGDGFAPAQAALSQAVDTVMAETIRPGMSDMEKVLSVFGWMKQYVKYDGEIRWDSSSAYSALVNRSAVCHGCAVTMNLLLRKAGIDCYAVLSYTTTVDVDHMWNAVKVDGRWYNIDPTAGFVPGYMDYNGFMRSTQEMTDGDNYCEHVTRLHVQCDETYLGDTPWRTSSFPFLYSEKYDALVNVENCALNNGRLEFRETAVYRKVSIDENGRASVTELAHIPGYVRCCSQEYEDRLYYLTYDGQVRSHCVSTGEDLSISGKNYKGLYMYLDVEKEELQILDGGGVVQDVLPISG